MVVIKYIFQFGFWPWGSTAITSWDDPRLLFGISEANPLACTPGLEDECTDNATDDSGSYYATYELLIILSIFIHRSVLKVLFICC